MATQSFRRILELLERHLVEYVVVGGGKKYEDVVDSAPPLNVGDLVIKVLSIDALIADKKTLARDRDLPTLRLLEAVLHRQQRE